MPYQIAKPEADALGKAMVEYYEEAWQEGVKGLFNNMARANMGTVTGYLDQASDTYASLKKKSKDKFTITFLPTLKKQVSFYLANRNDVASALVSVAETALTQLANKIPVPHLGSIVSQAISYAAGKGQEELHKRSVAEADEQLKAHSSEPVGPIFTSDTEAMKCIQESIDQYKVACKYIQTMPANISTFDDVVTFPAAVFKLQEALSHLRVNLDRPRWYLMGMQDRAEKIETVSKDYRNTLRNNMPAAVEHVLQTAYYEAQRKGETDITQKKYTAPGWPEFKKPDSKAGGATQIAAYLAHAVAQGYYDAGNRGPQIGRPRSGAVTSSMPPRPGAMPPPIRR